MGLRHVALTQAEPYADIRHPRHRSGRSAALHTLAGLKVRGMPA